MDKNFENLTVDSGINWYIDQLVSQKPEFKDLDQDTIEQIKKDLKDRVESYINTSILKQVPPSKFEELEKVLDTNNATKIQEFFQSNVEDLNQVVAIAMADFKNSYLGV